MCSYFSKSTTMTATDGSGLPIVPGLLASGRFTDTTGEHSVMP